MRYATVHANIVARLQETPSPGERVEVFRMVRFQLSAVSLGAGVATLSLLLAAASSGSTNASPRQRVFGVPAQRGYPAAMRRPMLRPRSDGKAPTPCSTDYMQSSPPPEYFVGIADQMEFAGGFDSAVLGGEGNEACDVTDGVGAGTDNLIGNHNGDANFSFIAGGHGNGITGSDSFIGAGLYNDAAGSGAFVGAGDEEFSAVEVDAAGFPGNVAGGIDSFVGSGDLNSVTGAGSFIGAGDYTYASQSGNTTAGNQISGTDSFIGAGDQNVVGATEAFLGSGGNNTIGSSASYASLLGGNRNNVSGEYASILGGFGNSASGPYAIVAGGDGDAAAGTLSFAAGYHADAGHNGSFVWSDFVSGSATLKDSAVNQFVVRSSGGVYVYSNEDVTTGVALTPGSGTWASVSDRSAKTDIVPLDDDSILAKVAALPVSAWRYKSESGVRHVGPMAQDFYAAFGVGIDDRHITSIDEDGVALAAIKALSEKLERKAGAIGKLQRENAAMQRRLAAIEMENGEMAGLRGELHRLEAAVEAKRGG
jgi:Chaperone of endosialidase